MIIDLRSDTITRPTPAMKQAMLSAPLGDDVFHEDPTVNALEEKVAKLFNKEAAIFCPSGTMTNQIAIKIHTEPGSEVICDKTAHIYNYEGGGIGFNSSASVRLIDGDLGRFTVNQVADNINPNNDHYPKTSMVSIENTVNRGGGSIWNLKEIIKISEFCRENKLNIHLDGARLFNALAETKEKTIDYGHLFDSISICLSKGLGAPVGSVLCGNAEFINKARRIRKVLGGGMRQAGILAAAGIFAIDNHIDRLKEDHQRAHLLAKTLEGCSFVSFVLPVQTNILIFELINTVDVSEMLNLLKNKGILALSIGKQRIRMLTHLDFTDEMLDYTIKTLKEI